MYFSTHIALALLATTAAAAVAKPVGMHMMVRDNNQVDKHKQPEQEHKQNQQAQNQHSEKVEHPDGNPNNVEITKHDVVNDNKHGIHSNVINHVAINGNNVNGQSTNKNAHGANGVVVDGKGNTVVLPKAFWQQFGMDRHWVKNHEPHPPNQDSSSHKQVGNDE